MLVQSRINQVEGDEGVAMGIDVASVAHIQGILANMYSDPHGAVAREYIANASDSHRLAGQTKPVEVSCVSDPFGSGYTFVVQDFGVGMSREEVEKHYAQYGASSKRDSEGQIGGFGIGCKSALAVANGFTVTAVKDGEVTTAAFTLGESGGGNYSVLHHETGTDEPNGVRVEVTFDSHRDLSLVRTAAENMLYYWPAGELRVEGMLSTAGLLQNTEGAPEGIAWGEENAYGLDNRIALVLGGIRYKVPSDALQKVRAKVVEKIGADGPGHLDFIHSWLNLYVGRQIYVLAGPSDVDLPPNRETVMATNRTIDWIVGRLEALSEHMFGEFAGKIEGAADLREAYAFAKEMWDASIQLGISPSEYQSTRWGAMSTIARLPVGATAREITETKVYKSGQNRVAIDSPTSKAVFVHGAVTASHHTRALRFWALENEVPIVVMMPDRKYENAWLIFDADDPDASTVEVGDLDKILAEGKALAPKPERKKAGKMEFTVGIVGPVDFEDVTPMTFEEALELTEGDDETLYYSHGRPNHRPGMAEGSVVIWGDGTARNATALQRRVDKVPSGDLVKHVAVLHRKAVDEIRENEDLWEKILREYIRRSIVNSYANVDSGAAAALRKLEYLRPDITHQGVLDFWDSFQPCQDDEVLAKMWVLQVINTDADVADRIQEMRKEITPPADIAPLFGLLHEWSDYHRGRMSDESNKIITNYINACGILY